MAEAVEQAAGGAAVELVRSWRSARCGVLPQPAEPLLAAAAAGGGGRGAGGGGGGGRAELQPRQQHRKISSAPSRICFMSPI